MNSALIRGDAVTKSYRRGSSEVHALFGVDVSLDPGEFLAIMGPSGCGKSTLLHILSGIDVPTSGRVVFGETDLGALSAERRATLRRDHMGLLFQEHALLPGLSVVENVSMPLALRGVDRATREKRAIELIDLVGLEGRAQDMPDDFSGGQRQRAALARALVNNPQVVLADEPTGALDSSTAHAVLDAMVVILRERGAALIMVTHDPVAAQRVDRVIVLRDGRLVTTAAREGKSTLLEVSS